MEEKWKEGKHTALNYNIIIMNFMLLDQDLPDHGEPGNLMLDYIKVGTGGQPWWHSRGAAIGCSGSILLRHCTRKQAIVNSNQERAFGVLSCCH